MTTHPVQPQPCNDVDNTDDQKETDMTHAFPRCIGIAPEQFNDFFRWINLSEYRTHTFDEGTAFKGLVKVTTVLAIKYIQDTTPGQACTPHSGYYIVTIDEQGAVQVCDYGDDEEASIADIKPWVEDSLYGEDPIVDQG